MPLLPILKTARRWAFVVVFCLSLLVPSGAVSAAAPVVDVNQDLNLPVNGMALINSNLLHASAPGYGYNQVVYTTVTVPGRGTLRMDGVALAAGDTFTQFDLEDERLSYSAPGEVGRDRFVFHVTAGSEDSRNFYYTIHVNRPEPAVYPVGLSAAVDGTGQITVTWTDVSGPGAPDGYVVLCSGWGDLVPPLDTAFPVNNPCTDGSGSAHAAPGVQSVTWEGLYSNSGYTFAIFPYTKTEHEDGGSFYDYFTADGWPTAAAATPNTYTITGIAIGDWGLMGVRIDTGGELSVYTGEDGSYSLTGLQPGEYTLTASLPCYRFDPPSQTITVSEAGGYVYQANFTAVSLPCVLGSVRLDGSPLAGVQVTDGAGHSAAVLEDGSYTFTAPTAPWSGRLAPLKTNMVFTPFTRVYIDLAAGPLYGEDFEAVPLEVGPHQFKAVWQGEDWATGYFLDVATDAGFTHFLPGFENRAVGNTTEYVVTGLSPHTFYYYRVRAHDAATTGESSIPVEVLTNWARYFPLVNP